MIIDDDLVIQWEPKIQKMLSNVFVLGMDRDDIAQELRIALIKAAKGFDETRGVIFHTYLHTALVNTIRSLITRVSKHSKVRSLDDTYKDTNLTALDILEALKDPTNDIEDVDVYEYIYSANLTDSEQSFLKLRYDGLTMEEISEDLGESSYKVRQTLREKISLLEIEYEKISQTG
tara:strand:+ start:231 stop:758 length:528 start_codon:yes stop_codon:yes gene_type:complete